MSESQERLFDPTRYSPVQVSIWQLLPRSSARTFAIASALGSIRDKSGSGSALKGGRGASGSLVTPRRLPAILVASGTSDRQWRRYVEEWEKLRVAHRCGDKLAFLFTAALPESCAACGRAVYHEALSPYLQSPKRQPGKRDESGRFTAKGLAVQRPTAGGGMANGLAVEPPDSERESGAELGGSLLGLGVGVPVVGHPEVITTGISRRAASEIEQEGQP